MWIYGLAAAVNDKHLATKVTAIRYRALQFKGLPLALSYFAQRRTGLFKKGLLFYKDLCTHTSNTKKAACSDQLDSFVTKSFQDLENFMLYTFRSGNGLKKDSVRHL